MCIGVCVVVWVFGVVFVCGLVRVCMFACLWFLVFVRWSFVVRVGVYVS